MRFTPSIELGNDAMSTAEDVADALEDAAGHLGEWGELAPGDTRKVLDVNGNTVGEWEVTA